MHTAIIDSGASCTYVTGDVELRNAKAGGGHVWVANGQKEEVVETGELGPLSGVRKVESFERSLISVTDLIEQFGPVVFNAAGVHLATELGKGEVCVTTIGHATGNRLFSIDADALQRHSQRLAQHRAALAAAA